MTRSVYTLLLIDDNASDREFYRRCLLTDETCTYHFLEANCAADGLGLAKSQTIDAILLALADGDSLAFLEALRDTEKIPPVIMISDQAEERVIVRAIKLGAADYLTKQRLDSERLQTIIHNSIENILSTSAILPSPTLAEDAMTLAGIRILIVDDEPDQIELMTFVLEDCGAVVQSAMSATSALDGLSEFQPDLLISDLAMPGDDGYELLRQVRLQPAGNIPAIVLTAYASTTVAERSRQAGFQCHLTKPVEPEILIEEILRLMKSGRSNDMG
jgi:CheY-like chemotaxis protein